MIIAAINSPQFICGVKNPVSKKSILVLLIVVWVFPFCKAITVTAADLDYLIHVGIVSSANSPEWRVAQLAFLLRQQILRLR